MEKKKLSTLVLSTTLLLSLLFLLVPLQPTAKASREDVTEVLSLKSGGKRSWSLSPGTFSIKVVSDDPVDITIPGYGTSTGVCTIKKTIKTFTYTYLEIYNPTFKSTKVAIKIVEL